MLTDQIKFRKKTILRAMIRGSRKLIILIIFNLIFFFKSFAEDKIVTTP